MIEGGSDGQTPRPPSEGRTSLQEYGGLSAVLAATAAGIYAVGLLSIFLPIALKYTNDFTTAWYAVSLIPNITVAGQGAKQLLVGPLGVLLLAFSIVLLVRYRRRQAQGGEAPEDNHSEEGSQHTGSEVWTPRTQALTALVGTIISALAGVLGVLIQIFFGGESTQSSANSFPLQRVVSDLLSALFTILPYVAPLVVGVPLGIALAWLTALYPPSEGWIRWLNYKPVRQSILGGLALAFVTALGVSAVLNPPLPSVKISWGTETTTTGHLLTHVDSFWYVFTEDNATLLAIPDQDVEKAIVCSNTPSKCSLQPQATARHWESTSDR
jgi:hypothetical protein